MTSLSCSLVLTQSYWQVCGCEKFLVGTGNITLQSWLEEVELAKRRELASSNCCRLSLATLILKTARESCRGGEQKEAVAVFALERQV